MEKGASDNTVSDLSLYLLTWNVIGTSPNEDLTKALGLVDVKTGNDVPDVYGIGLQELSISPQSMVMSTLFEDPWAKAFRDVLGQWDHVLMKTIRLYGMMIMFFAKRKHLIHLRNIQTDYTRTGFGGVWGNKGGVSIRFEAYGVSVCLTNCHLAAHDNELMQRIRDYHSIVEGQVFEGTSTKDILDHDYVFWFGDLNFRLNTYTAEKIANMIENEEWGRLLDSDQLLEVIKNKEAFADFKELPPPFKPSYKFTMNTRVYDLRRKPAWTDRILFKINSKMPALELHQKNYNMFEEYVQSDHKPVTAEFSITVSADGNSQSTVKFDPIDRWFIGQDGPCMYTRSSALRQDSNWDWIGLFKANFTNISEYVTYVWAAPFNGSEQQMSNFPDISCTPGHYRLLYMGNYGTSIYGMSESFEVVYDQQTTPS